MPRPTPTSSSPGAAASLKFRAPPKPIRFSEAAFLELLALAKKGIQELTAAQNAALGL